MDINHLLRSGGLNQLLEKALPERPMLRDLLASLRPGLLLQAKVLALPRPDVARLLINDVPLNARTSRPLSLGQTLQLVVAKDGDTPELRILQPGRPTTSQDVLRLALPRQLPLQESLTGMKALGPRLLPLLVGPAREALQTLLGSGVPVRQLSAERLRSLLRDSGLFTEARMARGQPPEAGDRKALLMRLASALPGRAAPSPPPTVTTQASASTTAIDRIGYSTSPAVPREMLTRTALQGAAADTARALPGAGPGAASGTTDQQAALGRLWRLVDASLARIQTHQAASLPGDDAARPAWQLDIPVVLAGGVLQTVEMRIEQEATAAEENGGEAGWQVTLGFSFSGLGPVKAGVRLVHDRIFTTFWCEQLDTVQRFDQQLPRLRQSLEEAGLDVAHLAASRGEPPAVPTALQPRNNLLDERA